MKKVLICFLMLFCIKAYAGNSTTNCQRPYFIPDVYEIVSCGNYTDWNTDSIIVKYKEKFGAYINWKEEKIGSEINLDENSFHNKIKIPAIYDDIRFVQYGFIVTRNGKYGYYNIVKGKVFDAVYDRIYLSNHDETVNALSGKKVISKENVKCRPTANKNAAGDIFFIANF